MAMSTLMIHKALMRRLDKLAKRTGLSTSALAHLWLEAAVNEEERRLARDQRVTRKLKAVLDRFLSRCMGSSSVSLGRQALPMHMRRTSE
jgi:predicted transcriptional regulator